MKVKILRDIPGHQINDIIGVDEKDKWDIFGRTYFIKELCILRWIEEIKESLEDKLDYKNQGCLTAKQAAQIAKEHYLEVWEKAVKNNCDFCNDCEELTRKALENA